jgi:predicted O-methyltransferase YrrM
MRNEIPKSQTYIESLVKPEAPNKQLSRAFADQLGLWKICLSPSEGHLLSLLIRMHQCRKFVEIGTLTGLSAQYISEGMSNQGQLWTLEKTPLHADKAKEALANHAAFKNIHFIVGDAQETLHTLNSEGPFDGVFIDGNKAAYGEYLAWAEKNVRKGGLIIADNVFLSGAVWGEATTQKFNDKQISALRAFNIRMSDPNLYDSAIMPTPEGLHVGIKLF